MTSVTKGIALAVVQGLLVASLGLKLHVDRARCPRAWARVAPVDPELPIRGRYVRLRIELDSSSAASSRQQVRLVVRGHRLIGDAAGDGDGLPVTSRVANGGTVLALAQPLAFFISEHAHDPSRLRSGEELWVEVTVPDKGPPRPIRLATKARGELSPLAAE
jgi:hypothetical protein